VPKAASEALVKGVAKEEGINNVRANSVLAGVIDAGMFHQLLERDVFDQRRIDDTRKLLALKRWGKAEEIGKPRRMMSSTSAGVSSAKRPAPTTAISPAR